MPEIDFTIDSQQGPLPGGFHIHLEGDYITLVGANNAAKTSILQGIFRKFWDKTDAKGRFNTCLILPERLFVHITTETGGQTLETYNNNLARTIGGSNRGYASYNDPPSSDLPRYLLNHWSLMRQLDRLNSYLQYFGLPQFDISGPQTITFEDIQIAVQGSGLRSIFAILAALTDEHIKLLLIDEPEQSLEARVQKQLRDLLYTAAIEQGKQIIVTTHSHLFLNRHDFTSNYAITKANNQVSMKQVASEAELYDITFRMLGSSVEDLFLPYNFMVVEGVSDQVIVIAVMKLQGISSHRIKVLAAVGVDNVANMLFAVCNSLTPLVVHDSPYASRVVALIDKPHKTTDHHYKELKKTLKDRLFTLDQPSLEEYLPACLYERCGRNKQEDISEMKRLKDDYEKLSKLKACISKALADILTVEDVQTIPIIAEAIEKASK